MAKSLPAAVFVLLLLGSVSTASAQASPPLRANEVLELTLRDGSRLYGHVEDEEATRFRFRTSSGTELEVARSEVVSLRRVRGRVQDGVFQRTDVHRSRLFFGPTARSLPKGVVSMGIFQIYAPFVQAGVTDRFSIGGGTPLIFGFDESERPFWVTPKLQILSGERRQAAIGALHLLNVEGDATGIAYGVGTFGSEDQALTVGAGLAYSDGSRGAIVMVGGESRPRANLKLITENYVWSGGGILSGGVRFIGDRLSADVGLAFPVGMDFFIAFPVVNFVYVF